MKISIFRKIHIPKDKEEKKSLAKLSASPNKAESYECRELSDFIGAITNVGWSPFRFKEYRLQKEFISTDFLVLDIDEGLTIEESNTKVDKLGAYCICLPTASHSKDNHRFRLIFPLSGTISDKRIYVETMKNLVEQFPNADPSCINDTARFYFPCKMSDDGYIFNGDTLLSPIMPKNMDKPTNYITNRVVVDGSINEIVTKLYGEERLSVPESIDFFVKNANSGIPGGWITALNSFSFCLGLQNVDYDVLLKVVKELAPEELDDRDLDCIDRAYDDGIANREEKCQTA